VRHWKDSYLKNLSFRKTCSGRLIPDSTYPTHLEYTDCHRVTYVNSEVGVTLLIALNDHVLLAQRAYGTIRRFMSDTAWINQLQRNL
jgi:hypothetical protein